MFASPSRLFFLMHFKNCTWVFSYFLLSFLLSIFIGTLTAVWVGRNRCLEHSLKTLSEALHWPFLPRSCTCWCSSGFCDWQISVKSNIQYAQPFTDLNPCFIKRCTCIQEPWRAVKKWSSCWVVLQKARIWWSRNTEKEAGSYFDSTSSLGGGVMNSSLGLKPRGILWIQITNSDIEDS
jgi:hypothetical protein